MASDRTLHSLLALPALAIGLAGCGSSTTPPPPAGPQVSMDFTAQGDFYAAPFPTDARTGLTGFPNPSAKPEVDSIVSMLQDAGGFGLTSGVFFELTGPITATLPGVNDSVAAGSPIVLIGVDPASPDYLQRYPVAATFMADGGPYGSPNLLALIPLQGVPLRPKTRYAAVVMDSLGVGPSPAMAQLAMGARPAGLGDAGFATYQAALAALPAAKIDAAHVAGLAAFTTGAPTDALGKVVAAMNASPPSPSGPWMAMETFPTFCVYQTTISMPEYQGGTPPYTTDGGRWVFDASGNPVLQRMEQANFVVTIPRTTMPAAGYPVVVLSRTGAGGNRPLVDRGVMGTTGGPPLVPGTGPALYYAAAGYAGSEIDGPLGGLRNTTNANEDFTIFNVTNPVALRDNVRQSAAELALQAHILEHVTVDVSACTGAVAPGNMATFDVGNMALMGHSMGATISPLTLAFEPRYKAGLLSGCGGSYIENVMYKQLPVMILGAAEAVVGDTDLSVSDPILSLLQWALEPADPPVYGRRIALEPEDGPPRNILMMQGIVDHYIMPPIADAASLSFGLDLAGPELDDTPAEIKGLAPVGPLLPLVGRGMVTLPVTANLISKGGAKVTAVLTQSPADGVEDGHEVVFQTERPKHQYVCFLKGLLQGKPTVPTDGMALDPCN